MSWWTRRRTLGLALLKARQRAVSVPRTRLLAGRADAPDGVSHVVGNQKRPALVDGESDRPSSRLSVRVKKIGDDILSFAIGMPALKGTKTTL